MQRHHLFLLRQTLLACCALLLAHKLCPPAIVFYGAGALALVGSLVLRNPWWWHLIQAIFFPTAYWASTLHLPGWTYLTLFALSALVFLGTFVSRVPLYLSGNEQCQKLIEHCASAPPRRFADLGAGIGSAIVHVAIAFPNLPCEAYEIAPLSYLIGRFRCRNTPNLRWHWQRFERASLRDCDLVYAFLSPEPMPALWEKALSEMPHGSILISNSFAIPGVEPETIYAEEGPHPLFVYRVIAQG